MSLAFSITLIACQALDIFSEGISFQVLVVVSHSKALSEMPRMPPVLVNPPVKIKR